MLLKLASQCDIILMTHLSRSEGAISHMPIVLVMAGLGEWDGHSNDRESR